MGHKKLWNFFFLNMESQFSGRKSGTYKSKKSNAPRDIFNIFFSWRYETPPKFSQSALTNDVISESLWEDMVRRLHARNCTAPRTEIFENFFLGLIMTRDLYFLIYFGEWLMSTFESFSKNNSEIFRIHHCERYYCCAKSLCILFTYAKKCVKWPTAQYFNPLVKFPSREIEKLCDL